MKAILEFNLPEDQCEYDTANNASKYYSVLWDLDHYLRAKVKYSLDGTADLEIKTYEKVRTELWKLMEDHNINILD